MIECIENLVGITSSNCNCFDSSKPTDFDVLNLSESGYYVDEFLQVKEEIYASINCEDDANIFTKMVEIRANSQKQFQTDLQVVLKQFYKSRVQPFSGLIGQTVFNRTQTLQNFYNGIQINPQRLKDAKFILTGIYAGFDTSQTLTATISSNNPNFTPVTQVLNIEAGKFTRTALTTPVELPFYTKEFDNCDCGLQYYVSYQKVDVIGLPLQNKLTCCSGNEPWKTHIKAGGFTTNNLSDLCDCGSSYAYGLALDGHIVCDNLNWICNLTELDGYDVRDVIARTIQFAATINFAKYILDSNEINYYTLLSRENLYGKISHYTKRYGENLHFIATNLSDKLGSLTGCYKCRDNGMVVNL